MKNADFDIPYLIFRHQCGTISPDEKRLLDLWIAEGEGNRQLFDKVSSIQALDKYTAYHSIDQKAAWRRLYRTATGTPLHKKILWQRWRAVAAAVVVMLSVGLLFQPPRITTPDDQIAVYDSPPDLHKIVLQLADGSDVVLDDVPLEVIMQGNAAVTVTDGALNYGDTEEGSEQMMNSIYIPRGRDYQIVFSDGTRVWLNSDSRLIYPLRFGEGARRVELSGEAYFEVSYHNDQPFVVATPGQQTTVLGTEFNIYAYGDETGTITTLVKGRIRIVTDAGAVADLQPGEQAYVADHNGDILIRQVDTYPFTSWKDGLICIDQQPLEQVMRQLSRWYDIHFEVIDDAVRGIVFYGDIPKANTLTSVLSTLSEASQVTFNLKDNIIEITTKIIDQQE